LHLSSQHRRHVCVTLALYFDKHYAAVLAFASRECVTLLPLMERPEGCLTHSVRTNSRNYVLHALVAALSSLSWSSFGSAFGSLELRHSAPLALIPARRRFHTQTLSLVSVRGSLKVGKLAVFDRLGGDVTRGTNNSSWSLAVQAQTDLGQTVHPTPGACRARRREPCQSKRTRNRQRQARRATGAQRPPG
jgi:hypothetical protein